MADQGDPGPELLDRLFERLMIDEPWAVREGRSFTWWAYRLAQHVVAEPPVPIGGRESCTIRVWTDVVRDVDGEVDPAAVMAVVNARQSMGALVWDAERRRVSECCTAVVHADSVHWMVEVLAIAALLQNSAAHSRAHALAEMIGGVPASSNHPASGERPEMDSTLHVPSLVVARAGERPSAFAGDLIRRVGDLLPQLNVLGFADDDALTCEVPFTGPRPAAEVMLTNEPIETALVRVFTGTPHPELGNGALLIMGLPLTLDRDDIVELANDLNLVEAQQDRTTTLLGAWCADPTTGGRSLAFTSFVPNALARPGILENLVIYQMVRSRFAAATLFDDD